VTDLADALAQILEAVAEPKYTNEGNTYRELDGSQTVTLSELK